MPLPDSRGYFKLPQRPEQAAYYTYGTPPNGLMQYAHPNLMTFLFQLEFRWGHHDNRKLGIGNISLAHGVQPRDHAGHRTGLQVDILPIRRDGKPLPVRYQDRDYDREATRRLVELIWQTGMANAVLFNDLQIPRVRFQVRHDDHLHVSIRA